MVKVIDKDKFNFLWVVDWPLFEYNEEENVSEVDFMLEFPQLFKKDMKYFIEEFAANNKLRIIEDEKLNKALEVYQQCYDELSLEWTTVYDGIIDLLEYLKQNNYKIGIVSNKDSKVVLYSVTAALYALLAAASSSSVASAPKTFPSLSRQV